MKRRKNNSKKDSPVLDQLARTIDARLPDQHGFALLTFPLGPTVDPRMRYVGKGNRADILESMQAWIDAQTGGVWGRHDDRPSATQWTTAQPTEPGLYLVKTKDLPAGQFEPEFVKLDTAPTDASRPDSDIGLRLNYLTENTWSPTEDFVADIDPMFAIWFGPFPEPWKDAAPAPLMEGPDEPTPEAAKNIIALSAGLKPENAFVEEAEQHHAQAITECVQRLTFGIPNEGGHVSLEVMRDLVRAAFISGTAAQFMNPIVDEE